MKMKTECSPIEYHLVKAISPHWANIITRNNCNMPTLYGVLAQQCFMDNRKGPEVEALRRVVKAINTCSVYRMTPEFDKLCEF